jgi:hypothetical protein
MRSLAPLGMTALSFRDGEYKQKNSHYYKSIPGFIQSESEGALTNNAYY